MNKVILMGRLTRDPDVRYSAGENALAIARYTLAVDRRFKRDGEATADFISCVAWRQTGEFVSKYFTKGRMAVVEGRLQMRDWTDKNGNKRRSYEVQADNVYFADNRRPDGNDTATPQYAAESAAGGFSEVSEDDGMLPF